MLEVCFGQSAWGALRVAQHCGGGAGKISGAVFGRTEEAEEGLQRLLRRAGKGVAFTTIVGFDDGEPPTRQEIRRLQRDFRRRQELLEREAVPLGGSPADVLTLSLGLDVGDIREPLGEERRELLRQWYGQDGTGHCAEALRAADKHWQETQAAAERLRACGPGDAVRIWVDQTPHSACGLLHAASLLKDTKAAVSMVTLPPWRARSDNAVEAYLGWGEVAPELFGHFLFREEPLSPAVLGALAGQWRELQRENAPLRAVINGRVHSVGEDFYDPLIRRHLPEGTIKVGTLIGEVLGRERPGIGDDWLAGRIRWMLSAGELRMVREDRERFYGSAVERA